MTQSTIEFGKIRNNWTILKKEFESVDFIHIENFLHFDDSISIERVQNTYRIRIKLELEIRNSPNEESCLVNLTTF